MRLDLLLRDIAESIVLENFKRIQSYLNKQSLLQGNWQFFEVEVQEGTNHIRHRLSFVPKDIILTSIIGDYRLYFNYVNFDKDNIYVTAQGPAVIRFFAGRYGDKTYGVSGKTLPFVDPNAIDGGGA